MLRNELWDKLKQFPKGDLDQGIALMQQYLQESVNDATIMSELAYWFYRKGDDKSLEQALLLCEAALLQQDTWETTYIMGLITARLGDDLLAISCLEKAREGNPTFPDTHYALGEIYFEQENYPKALEYFKKTLEIMPRFRSSESYLEAILEKLK